MSFAILRIQKHKSGGGLGASSSHVMRTRDTPNADPSISNMMLVGGEMSPQECVLRRVGEVSQVRGEGSRAIRKDAVVAVEHVLTVSPEWFNGKTRAQVEQWARHSLAFLQQIYGKENIVSAVLHLDEKTPHIHAYHVPVAMDKAGRPSLAAKSFYGSRKALSELQDAYAKHMQKLDPEIARGLKGSRAGHKEISEWHSEVRDAERIIKKTVPTEIPTVEIPPLMVTEKARKDWADGQNARMESSLNTFFSRFKKILKLGMHYKNKYKAERDRTELFREHIGENPADFAAEASKIKKLYQEAVSKIAELSKAIDRYSAEYYQMAERATLAEVRADKASGAIKAIAEACGIRPDQVEAAAPYIKKKLDRLKVLEGQQPNRPGMGAA